MKESYTLPWTCKQQEKVERVMAWVCLIGFPILLVTSIVVYGIKSDIGYALFFSGLLGSFISWFMAYMLNFIRFPSFKCKTDKITERSSE